MKTKTELKKVLKVRIDETQGRLNEFAEWSIESHKTTMLNNQLVIMEALEKLIGAMPNG